MQIMKIGAFLTRNNYLHKHLNPAIEADQRPDIKKGKIIYPDCTTPLSGYSEEKLPNCEYLSLENSKNSLLDSYGYTELELDRSDYQFVKPELEITVEYVAIGSQIQPSLSSIKGRAIMQEIKNFKIDQEIDDKMPNFNIFRFEKLEMPWESSWVLTDINSFMAKKHGPHYYETPSLDHFKILDC